MIRASRSIRILNKKGSFEVVVFLKVFLQNGSSNVHIIKFALICTGYNYCVQNGKLWFNRRDQHFPHGVFLFLATSVSMNPILCIFSPLYFAFFIFTKKNVINIVDNYFDHFLELRSNKLRCV